MDGQVELDAAGFHGGQPRESPSKDEMVQRLLELHCPWPFAHDFSPEQKGFLEIQLKKTVDMADAFLDQVAAAYDMDIPKEDVIMALRLFPKGEVWGFAQRKWNLSPDYYDNHDKLTPFHYYDQETPTKPATRMIFPFHPITQTQGVTQARRSHIDYEPDLQKRERTRQMTDHEILEQRVEEQKDDLCYAILRYLGYQGQEMREGRTIVHGALVDYSFDPQTESFSPLDERERYALPLSKLAVRMIAADINFGPQRKESFVRREINTDPADRFLTMLDNQADFCRWLLIVMKERAPDFWEAVRILGRHYFSGDREGLLTELTKVLNLEPGLLAQYVDESGFCHDLITTVYSPDTSRWPHNRIQERMFVLAERLLEGKPPREREEKKSP